MKQRNDDFEVRRSHLKNLSDAELKAYFEKLTDQLLDPMLDLAYNNTSKAIERSVLMRMGFSSLEAKALTEKMMECHLLEHGAGHVVFLYAKKHKIAIREAGLRLMDMSEMMKTMEEFK